MEAASQNGIPTAFIVGKEGHIEWIGHPMEIDEPIAAVVDGSWNRKEFAEEFIASQKIDAVINQFYELMQNGKSEEAMKLIDETIAETKSESAAGQLKMMKLQIVVSQKMQDDPKEALKFLDESIANSRDEDVIAVARSMRTQIAISIGGEEAVKALNDAAKTMKDSPEELNGMAWTIVEMAQSGEDVSKALLDAATNVAEVAAKGAPESASILDTFSHLLHLQGNLDKAIEVQTKAVDLDGGEIPEIKQFLKQLNKEKASRDDDKKESDKK
jgi:tetratricopeptide (TPR) repeat protein